MPSNDLYLVVLPLIHLATDNFGRSEQVLTLVPEISFATKFYADEVETYVATFKNRIHLFTGGHVKDYKIFQEATDDNRVIVRVVQNVG
jgi:hypothetical protein